MAYLLLSTALPCLAVCFKKSYQVLPDFRAPHIQSHKEIEGGCWLTEHLCPEGRNRTMYLNSYGDLTKILSKIKQNNKVKYNYCNITNIIKIKKGIFQVKMV